MCGAPGRLFVYLGRGLAGSRLGENQFESSYAINGLLCRVGSIFRSGHGAPSNATQLSPFYSLMLSRSSDHEYRDVEAPYCCTDDQQCMVD